MKITSDKPSGKAAMASTYHDLFSQLTHENNCIVFETKKEMDKVSQALDNWSKKHIHKDCLVRTTKAHIPDGKPRCWLIWPRHALPVKSEIRGNWPAK